MDNNKELRVGSNRPFRFYIHEAKEILKTTGKVEVHAIGSAIANAAQTAESLVSLGYGELSRFETFTTTQENSGIESRRFKAIFTLTKTSNFDTLYEQFKEAEIK